MPPQIYDAQGLDEMAALAVLDGVGIDCNVHVGEVVSEDDLPAPVLVMVGDRVAVCDVIVADNDIEALDVDVCDAESLLDGTDVADRVLTGLVDGAAEPLAVNVCDVVPDVDGVGDCEIGGVAVSDRDAVVVADVDDETDEVSVGEGELVVVAVIDNDADDAAVADFELVVVAIGDAELVAVALADGVQETDGVGAGTCHCTNPAALGSSSSPILFMWPDPRFPFPFPPQHVMLLLSVSSTHTS
jgi:hypothetical protein